MFSRWLLWDVDGTLVRFSGSSIDKHAAAAEYVSGITVGSDLRTAGMTDREIIARILEAGGRTVSDGEFAEAIRVLEDLSEQEMTDDYVHALDGVAEALSATADAGWTNGLLTGNTHRRAMIKLQAAGLWPAVSEGGGFFGDHHDDRFALAAAGAMAVAEHSGAQAVVIGDTPLDIRAARAAGLPVVAVASGKFSLAELRSLEPDLLVPDLVVGAATLLEFLDGVTRDSVLHDAGDPNA